MKNYHMSLRCYFPGLGNYNTHYTDMPLKDIKKWIEAYEFTHPNCQAIMVKVYLKEAAQGENEERGGRGDLLQPGDQEGPGEVYNQGDIRADNPGEGRTETQVKDI